VIDNSRASAFLPVTDSSPDPGDFPLGSTESRAAARALADRLGASGEVLRVVVEHIGRPQRNQEFVIPLRSQ
jgi:hypothetical protein